MGGRRRLDSSSREADAMSKISTCASLQRQVCPTFGVFGRVVACHVIECHFSQLFSRETFSLSDISAISPSPAVRDSLQTSTATPHGLGARERRNSLSKTLFSSLFHLICLISYEKCYFCLVLIVKNFLSFSTSLKFSFFLHLSWIFFFTNKNKRIEVHLKFMEITLYKNFSACVTSCVVCVC